MNYFKHPTAIVESESIGKGTRIWAFSHILPKARIGEDCNICDHTFIENDVVIGDRVTIKCGVQIWDGVTLDNDVFVGPNATFTNDPFPRSKQPPEQFVKTIVHRGASIGANATILPGIVVGVNAMVGAGSVVTRDVPPNAIVMGNPARIEGYIAPVERRSPEEGKQIGTSAPNMEVSTFGVKLYKVPIVSDLRGSLSFGEFDKHLPFVPKRYFIVYDVPSKEVRGEHAHKKLHQFLICIKGSCSVALDDGQNRDEVRLNTPGIGLYIPSLVWAVQYKYTNDAVLLVFASEAYDAEDYIRDYNEFLEIRQMK